MGGVTGVVEDSVTRSPHTWRPERRNAAPLTVRALMRGLILAVVVPLLAFSAFLVLRSAGREQELMAHSVRERTQAAAAIIDYELALLRAKLYALASSRHLQAGNFAEFHAQATAAMEEEGLQVLLTDLTGQEIVNTRAPYGTPLPVSADLDGIGRVALTAQPNVSNRTVGTLTGQPVIAINVPVFRDDRLTYVLSLNIAPHLPLILALLDLPPEWIVAVSDRRGVTIARSRDAERFVGQMGRPAILSRFREADTGWFPSTTRDGIPAYNAFTHVKLAGWVIAVGIPDDVLFAPVRRSTLILILLGGATVIVALVLATLIGWRIARANASLVSVAEAVGRDESPPLTLSGIRETDAVACSLHRAGQQLRQAARELRDSEQQYRALSEALAVANEERTELLHQTVTRQEAERQRIARELHDSLGQYLTALRLGFDAIAPICTADAVARQRLSQLKELTSELGHEFRRMAWELRPMALDDLGLRNAIAQYLEEWAERSGLHIDLAITIGERHLPQPVQTALFRVLQEAITNVVKHSGADQVGVILEATEGEVRLIIEDNGRGFEIDEGTVVALGKAHLGLLGVRERLALVNGSLEVESAPNGGTTVYACVPIVEESKP